MTGIARIVPAMLIVLALVAVAMGAAFIQQGVEKENLIVSQMRQEKIVYGLDDTAVKAGKVVDNPAAAEKVASTLEEHRKAIAPTYNDLLKGKKFDPTNPEQITYGQAMNMQNSLNLAVLGFGVVTVVKASGAFMILMGLATGGTGIGLLGLAGKNK